MVAVVGGIAHVAKCVPTARRRGKGGAHVDEGGIEHAGDGRHEGDDDLLQRLDPLEQPKDAEGAQHPQQPKGARQVDAEDGEHADEDDEDVELVPAAADEGAEPVRVRVDHQLGQEDVVEDVLDQQELVRVVVAKWVGLLLDDVGKKVGEDERGDRVLAVIVVVKPRGLRLEREERGDAGDVRLNLGRCVAR